MATLTPPQHDALCRKQAELTALIDRLTGTDGAYPTAITSLTLYRMSAPSAPVHGVQKPTFCVIAQGGKLTVLGAESHRHDSAHYLLLSVELPLTVQITEASPASPYLGMCLDIEPRQISGC